MQVSGRAVRLDQVASLILALRLGSEVLFGLRRIHLDGASVALGGHFLVLAISSATAAPDTRNSLLQTVNTGMIAATYVWLINVLNTRESIDRFVRTNLIVASLAIGLAVLIYLTALAGLTFIIDPIGFSESLGYGAYGTMREPNIFGSYATFFFVLGLTTVAGRAFVSNPTLLARVRLLAGIGLLLSFTRAAWIGAASMILPVLVGLRRPLRWRTIFTVAGTLVLAVGIAASPLVPENYLKFKVLNLFNFETSSAVGRLEFWDAALQETWERPWLGWGCYSFGDLHGEPGVDRMLLPWIGNFAITALHDSGIIGALLFAVFLGINVFGGLRLAKRIWARDPKAAVQLVGLAYGVVALLIAFLATTGFSYAYPWIALGLLGARRRQVRALLQSPP